MLTRDINLADEILDLIDNCLDGALRLVNSNEVDYSQHFVKAKLPGDHSLIIYNYNSALTDLNLQRDQKVITQRSCKTANKPTRRRVVS